jgi:hypothetical protein
MAMATCPGSSVSPLSHCANLHNRITGVREGSLGHNSPFVVQHAGLVRLTRPVDANVDPIIAFHYLTSRFFFRPPMMLHHPCTGARGATPHGTCINGQPRRGAGPREALGKRRGISWHSRQGGRIHIPTYHQTKKERVAHRVHRLWDRFKNPACGLVDNASKDF